MSAAYKTSCKSERHGDRTGHARGAPSAVSDGGGGGTAQLSAPAPAWAAGRAATPFALAGIQRKIQIGPADDAYEREADRVADQVLGGGTVDAASISRLPAGGLNPRAQRQAEEEEAEEEEAVQTLPVQRQGGGEEEEEELRRQPAKKTEELRRQAVEDDELQLKAQSGAVRPTAFDGALEAVQAVRRGGEPLPDTARGYFEPRFGADLGGVRVHTGETAARATSEVNARAFTLGTSIAFAPGQFDPSGAGGRRLLAHELTHVLQHAGRAPATIRRIPAKPEGAPFIGKILPWSAALRVSARRGSKVLADLPQGSRVTVLGGRAWILVEAVVDGKKLQGYVSHELIEATGEPLPSEVLEAGEEPGVESKPEEEATDTGETGEKEAEEPDHFTYDPRLNLELREQVNRMVGELKKQEISYGELKGIRSNADAHLFSTAYSIHEGLVPLEDLQALPGGKDADDNVWYKKEWETYSPWIGSDRPATDEEIMEKAKEHALEASPRTQVKQAYTGRVIGLTYAEEGYTADDPSRAPNVKSVPVSVHTAGNAIDLEDIDWDRLGGKWSAEANAFVAKFGLWRPFNPDNKGSEDNPRGVEEWWHFELLPAKTVPVSEPEE